MEKKIIMKINSKATVGLVFGCILMGTLSILLFLFGIHDFKSLFFGAFLSGISLLGFVVLFNTNVLKRNIIILDSSGITRRALSKKKIFYWKDIKQIEIYSNGKKELIGIKTVNSKKSRFNGLNTFLAQNLGNDYQLSLLIDMISSHDIKEIFEYYDKYHESQTSEAISHHSLDNGENQKIRTDRYSILLLILNFILFSSIHVVFLYFFKTNVFYLLILQYFISWYIIEKKSESKFSFKMKSIFALSMMFTIIFAHLITVFLYNFIDRQVLINFESITSLCIIFFSSFFYDWKQAIIVGGLSLVGPVILFLQFRNK